MNHERKGNSKETLPSVTMLQKCVRDWREKVGLMDVLNPCWEKRRRKIDLLKPHRISL